MERVETDPNSRGSRVWGTVPPKLPTKMTRLISRRWHSSNTAAAKAGQSRFGSRPRKKASLAAGSATISFSLMSKRVTRPPSCLTSGRNTADTCMSPGKLSM